jgi:hypothetical protein
LRLANIILSITLSLPWWGFFFHRLHQLVYALHLHQNLLHGLKKLSLDDQQLLKHQGWVLILVVVVIVGIVAPIIFHLNNRVWCKYKIEGKDEL